MSYFNNRIQVDDELLLALVEVFDEVLEIDEVVLEED